MYKLHIQNESVCLNMALIIDQIRHQRLQKPQAQRTKNLYFGLDLKTGLLHLPTEPQYKAIQLHLDLDKHDVHITEKNFGEKVFDMEGMDAKGIQVLSETCSYLKSALAHLHDIHELVHIEFDPSMDMITGRALLHGAWHAIEREDAELMLLNTTPGTYLFRKDRFAGVMEEILSGAKKSRIKCFTLTYLDPQNQVRDKTIIAWKDHWLFYDDDPKLTGKYFQTLEDLLASLGTILKRPLPAVKLGKS